MKQNLPIKIQANRLKVKIVQGESGRVFRVGDQIYSRDLRRNFLAAEVTTIEQLSIVKNQVPWDLIL